MSSQLKIHLKDVLVAAIQGSQALELAVKECIGPVKSNENTGCSKNKSAESPI